MWPAKRFVSESGRFGNHSKGWGSVHQLSAANYRLYDTWAGCSEVMGWAEHWVCVCGYGYGSQNNTGGQWKCCVNGGIVSLCGAWTRGRGRQFRGSGDRCGRIGSVDSGIHGWISSYWTRAGYGCGLAVAVVGQPGVVVGACCAQRGSAAIGMEYAVEGVSDHPSAGTAGYAGVPNPGMGVYGRCSPYRRVFTGYGSWFGILGATGSCPSAGVATNAVVRWVGCVDQCVDAGEWLVGNTAKQYGKRC